ncbi:HAMP domain-containing histidine kinase [Crossiella sp. SN42]|uniref:sensor histidine kinase n=1 Tax=Crossiella sp. SN42 TaxID=2944808 RepID=UPI00207D35FA|nr:HAMP domain-containing sensor histidine kinase [Crossiella sp. SN42]MCO1578089.1 HAMP domain-containing histidine kinase [Crossiella sp. SN42]
MAWRFASLRGRLLAGTILLASAGVVVVDAAAYLGLQHYLQVRVDQSLRVVEVRVKQVNSDHRELTAEAIEAMRALSPSGSYFALVDGDGRVIEQVPVARPGGREEAPPELTDEQRRSPGGEPQTVRSKGDPELEYRALVIGLTQPLSTPDGRSAHTIVAATSLRPDHETLAGLAGYGIIATLVTVGGIALLSLCVLWVGLKPLRDMAANATAIAAGDHTRRIGVTGGNTEVDQLAHAVNLAFDARQRSEERLRSFVADASHELRTPLTTIRGWADLYLQGVDDPQVVELAMTRIEDEATRMHSLVEELLLLARLDQGRPLLAEPVDLAALAADAVADARVVDPEREINLVISTIDAVVRGDANRLRQVLRNLLGNALQHTPAGSPVHVSVRAVGDKGVGVVVADEGPGLSPDQLGRVFERFYRGDSSRGRGGAGLGLSIVRAISEAHGGSVWVDSQPGQGAAFTVVIPRGAHDVSKLSGDIR